MRITSNYYDYYSQLYALNSLANEQCSTSGADYFTDEAEAAALQPGSAYSMGGSMMGQSVQGKLMRDALQQQQYIGPAEMSEKMEQMKTTMESLKTADIDSMTADEVKEMLTDLKTDLEAMPMHNGPLSDIAEVDLDGLSETEMRDMLKQLQEEAAKHEPERKAPHRAESINLYEMLFNNLNPWNSEDQISSQEI